MPIKMKRKILMKKSVWFLGFVCCNLFMLACNKKSFVDFSENAFLLLGGGQTIIDEGSGAFSHGFNNMTESQERIHEIGDITFEQAFVSAPAPKYGGRKHTGLVFCRAVFL